MKNVMLMTLLLCAANPAFADYNANVKRKITEVLTYTDRDQIYFRLENSPDHPSCNNAYFVIPHSVPVERRQMLLSRLLVAYTTQEIMNIGYDNIGSCADGYIRVHRVG